MPFLRSTSVLSHDGVFVGHCLIAHLILWRKRQKFYFLVTLWHTSSVISTKLYSNSTGVSCHHWKTIDHVFDIRVNFQWRSARPPRYLPLTLNRFIQTPYCAVVRLYGSSTFGIASATNTWVELGYSLSFASVALSLADTTRSTASPATTLYKAFLCGPVPDRCLPSFDLLFWDCINTAPNILYLAPTMSTDMPKLLAFWCLKENILEQHFTELLRAPQRNHSRSTAYSCFQRSPIPLSPLPQLNVGISTHLQTHSARRLTCRAPLVVCCF